MALIPKFALSYICIINYTIIYFSLHMKHKLTLLITAFAAMILCASACGNRQPAQSIPSDKKEIIDRFLEGTLDPSYTPALFFGRPVLGGFNRKAEIGKASPEEIAAMTREIIANGPRGHLMIGADCSVPSPLNITDKLHAAISTAHGR